jgi:hypothetical protein
MRRIMEAGVVEMPTSLEPGRDAPCCAALWSKDIV